MINNSDSLVIVMVIRKLAPGVSSARGFSMSDKSSAGRNMASTTAERISWLRIDKN